MTSSNQFQGKMVKDHLEEQNNFLEGPRNPLHCSLWRKFCSANFLASPLTWPSLSSFVSSPDVVLSAAALLLILSPPKTNGQWAAGISIGTTHVLEQEPLIQALMITLHLFNVQDTAGPMSLGLDDGDDVNGQRGGLVVLACRVFEEPDQVFIQPGRSSNGDEVVAAMGRSA